MMKPGEVKQLMEVERKCVHWNDIDICNRNCGACELVQPTEKLLEAYDYVIALLSVLEDWRGLVCQN